MCSWQGLRLRLSQLPLLDTPPFIKMFCTKRIVVESLNLPSASSTNTEHNVNNWASKLQNERMASLEAHGAKMNPAPPCAHDQNNCSPKPEDRTRSAKGDFSSVTNLQA